MDRKTLFFLGISILILAVMLYFIGIEEVVEALKLANIYYIIIAILIQFAIFFLYTLRWKVLNDLADIKTSIGKTLPILLVGLAINNLTPSGRGGGERKMDIHLKRHLRQLWQIGHWILFRSLFWRQSQLRQWPFISMLTHGY